MNLHELADPPGHLLATYARRAGKSRFPMKSTLVKFKEGDLFSVACTRADLAFNPASSPPPRSKTSLEPTDLSSHYFGPPFPSSAFWLLQLLLSVWLASLNAKISEVASGSGLA